MENKLKVGQTFEVVEVLDGGRYIEAFVNGLQTIKIDDNFVTTHSHYREYPDNVSNSFYHLYLCDKEIKPIGKLTITKVK